MRSLQLATFSALVCLAGLSLTAQAGAAVGSAELYTGTSYTYGRFEARVRFAPGDGVISSFFLWKNGSEISGTFWNELDFEKVGADCHLETNAFFGTPAVPHPDKPTLTQDLCGEFHDYVYEWTPDYIAWFLDDTEIRRETGATAKAFADNATAGMQIRFNIWPGDATFGGNFSPSILPVKQTVEWVQYSSYDNGEFTVEWRDEFDSSTLDSRWLTGSWASPKNKSTHLPANVAVVDGAAVLSLTPDPAGSSTGGSPGTGGAGGATAGAPPACGGSDSSDGCALRAPKNGSVSGAILSLALAAGVLARRRHRKQISQ